MMHSIKRNFLYNILLNISSVIFPLVTAPYVARVLEPEGIGLFNFANVYSGYFSLVALLGIPTYGVREVAKVRDNLKETQNLLSELMSISTIVTIMVSIVYIVTLVVVNQLSENYLIFLVAGIAIYLSPLRINWYYQGLEDFGGLTIRTLVIRFVSICCLFLFVRQKDDVIIYLALSVLGSTIAEFWNFILLWRSGIHPRFTLKGLKKHLRPLLILFSSIVASSVYTMLDTVMLGFITDYEQVGYYNTASHLSKVLLSLVTSLSIVAIPRVSYYIKNNKFDDANNLVGKSFAFVSFLGIPMGIGLMCISPIFVPWFFGNQYQGAIVPMMILGYLIIAIGFSNIAGIQVLVGCGKDNYFLSAILVGTFMNFFMNLVMIPFFGAIGASVSSLMTEMIVTVIMLYFIYKKTPIRIHTLSDVIKSLVGALLLIPLKFIVSEMGNNDITLFLYIFSGTAIYIISQKILRNSFVTLAFSTLSKTIRK